MLFAGVVCVCAAVASTVFGLRTLTRVRSDEPGRLTMRAMAPAQLAAAVMLAVGGVVALAGPPDGTAAIVVICAAGALGTLAAGSWQGARYTAQRGTVRSCVGSCATCTLSCH